MKKIVHVAQAILVLSLVLAPVCRAAEAPPNVVLIFADDLGYGDLGCYGATKVKTPNIDRLAAEGRRFTDAHSSSAVCTPSRYGLLTGEYPHRKGIWGPCSHTAPLLIDTEKLTLAQLFKNKGYATSCFGKWHLGFGNGRTDWTKPLRPGPLELGFDYYFGVPKVNSGFPYVFVENHGIFGGDPKDPLLFDVKPFSATPTFPLATAGRKVPNRFGGAKKAHELYHDERIATVLTERAVGWIESRNKQKPFFLYLPTTNIHHPCTPAPRFKGTSQCGAYGDFIHELDWVVGEILACLQRNKLAENTIVIFTSDNGGMFNTPGQNAFQDGHRLNSKLLGFKFGVWEGGHRVPFIVRWPNRVRAGTTSNQLIGQVDMLATFAAVTSQNLDKAQQADSLNMLAAFVGEPEKPIRDHLVLAPFRKTHLSVRKGNWVFIPRQGSGGFSGKNPGDHTFAGPPAASFVGSVNSDIENGKIKRDAPPAQLYDLKADVRQTQNVHDDYPEIVKEMSSLLASYASKIQTPRKQRPRPRKRNGKPAKKTPASPSTRSASFDFESGKLEPWKVIEGKFGHPIGSRENLFRNEQEYNKQGKYYLTTLEATAKAAKGMDSQTGLIVSPLFIPQEGTMTFRIGGGGGQSTYAALCTADGVEVQTARGVNNQTMQNAAWDLTAYVGQKMFIKVVDRSTDGWGHITVDDFQFDAEVLTEYPPLPR